MFGRKKVLRKVLENISIDKSRENEIFEETKKVLDQLKKGGFKLVLGGSLAKNTLIKKEKQDVDIFAVFENEKQTKKFPLMIKKLKIKGKFLHGSRDYFVFEKNKILFEIIPVLQVNKLSDVKNVTDFSIKHVNYVRSKISKNKNLSDEIKLAKSFCYAQKVYGAESYIQGFSGYSLEVLICYYGSFINFLKKIRKEKIIDPEKQFKNKNEILREINESKLISPIILVDPVYKYRNVCAGLSQETFNEFINAGRKFLKNPSKKFFEIKTFELNDFRKKNYGRKNYLVELHLSTTKQAGDIAGTKMKKFYKHLIRQVQIKDQKILDKEFLYSGKDKKACAFLVVEEKNPILIKGPSKKRKKELEEFKKVRKKIFFKKGFAYTKEVVSLKDIIKNQTPISKGMNVKIDFKISKNGR